MKISLGVAVVSILGFSLSLAAPRADVASGGDEWKANGKQAFCPIALTPEHGVNWIVFNALASNPDSLLSFTNFGGVFRTGVCWWHSLFTRNAIYLTVYHPDLPRPDRKRAKKLIHAIRKGSKIVEIPGYADFREFSRDWEKEIKKELQRWEAHDMLLFKWVEGVFGHSKLSPKKLARRMDQFFELFSSKPRLYFQMLQMPGIPTHSWLVLHMQPILGPTGNRIGYLILYVDSNYRDGALSVKYYYGDEQIHEFTGPAVPYTHNANFKGYEKAIRKYCAR